MSGGGIKSMPNKQVHLSRIIDYLIFTQKPFSIFYNGNEQQRVLLVAKDFNGAVLQTQLFFPEEYEKFVSLPNCGVVNTLVRYRGQALKFEMSLHSIEKPSNKGREWEFYFFIPDEATIIERRTLSRLMIIDRKNRLQVCISDLSGNILAAPETVKLHDVTAAGISVWCHASKIDLCNLLNNKIKIIIKSQDKMVLENTGFANKTNGMNIPADRILITIIFNHLKSASTPILPRRFKRMDMKIGAPTYVSFHYPFIPERRVFGRLEDLSENGACLVLRQKDTPIPAGLCINDIEIQMPYSETLHTGGSVVYSHTCSTTSDSEQKVGTQFATLINDIPPQILHVTRLLSSARKKTDSSTPLFVKADGNITVQINTMVNREPRRLTSQGQIEFSHSHLRFNLARVEGLLLPRRKLNQIMLYRGGLFIADSTGTVEAVDFSGDNWFENRRYKVTVRFNPSKEIKQEANGLIKRKRNRIRFAKEDAFPYIKAVHPLHKRRTLYGHLHDLSIVGMSFYVREASVPLFPGLIVYNLSIQFPFQHRIEVNLVVTSCTLLDADSPYQYRIGGKFETLDIEERNTIALAIQQVINKNIYEGSEDDFNRLWEFYFESGFIYSKKRQQISSYSNDIIDTYRKLLKHENPIFKVFLYKEDDDIKGHLSAIHFFDNAWMVQHLTAAKGTSGSAAKAVLDPMIDFFDDLHNEYPDEQNYIFFFYREENTFPAIVFGNIKEKAADKEVSDSIDLEFCLPKPYNSFYNNDGTQHHQHVIREANCSDLEELEKLLLSKESIPIFQLEGLNKESIVTLSLESEYKRLGLYRFRKVYTAEDNETGTRCFIVANYSSPGINFSELNNSFRIYHDNKNDKTTAQLTACLTRHVLNSYIETGIAKPVLLCGTHQNVPPLFEKAKRYKYFYFNISHMELFKSVTAESIQSIKKYIRRRRLSNMLPAEKNGVELNEG